MLQIFVPNCLGEVIGTDNLFPGAPFTNMV